MSPSERRLAAIMFSDIVGYTALMAENETHAIAARDRHRRVLGERAAAYHGEVADENGDELVLWFASAVDAVNCALAVQTEGLGEAVELRIGIHLGDVVFEAGRVYGDGVNLASRVRPFAQPGGLCVSEEVANAIHNQPNVEIESIGAPPLKNVDRPVELYTVTGEALPPAGHASGEKKRRSRSLVALFAAAGIAVSLGLVWWNVSQPTEPQEKTNLPLSDRPSIAVLPFANVGKESEQDYFADGVTEDIITTLGRFTNLVVMAWNAVRPYRATPSVAQEASRDLNVRYLVDGSIRRSPDRVRVSVQLIEAATGVLLWSDRFDRPIDDIFMVQDEIVQGIVGSLAAEVGALEGQRALTKPTDSLSAYDYFLRGRGHLRRLTRPANLAAREMFEKAIEIDPKFAAAYAGLGWTHNYDAAYGWNTEPDRALRAAHQLVQKAIRLEPSNASAHTLLSQIHVYRQRLDLAIAAIDRAIELNGSAAESHAHRGWVMLAAGQPQEAIASGETALRFDPNSSPVVFGNLGWAYFIAKRYEDAIATLERALTLTKDSEYPFALIALVASYVESGRSAEAARSSEALRRLSPFFDVAEFSLLFQDASDRTRIVASLRSVGFE